MSVRTIARRYAEALFLQVKESGAKNAEKIWEELSELALLSETNGDFSNIVKNPTISPEEKISVFTALKKSGKISDPVFVFISLLIEKKRLILLSDIDKEIKHIILKEENKLEAEVVFAAEAADSVKNELAKRLEKITGKNIILKTVIDPEIIGGVKVRMGSALYDATIKGGLDKLKASLL
ncbi:MAG: ATP synthase F1 subunit delta [Mucispirillum sp.]|nr:ATP synthase F1 subunit delta [Mucispirillum sp.]